MSIHVTVRAMRLRVLAFVLVLVLVRPPGLSAQSAIEVGTAAADPSTSCCLGLVLPIANGDSDFDAHVAVAYRELGGGTWRNALPLLRVRPDTLSTETPPAAYGFPVPGEQFAGSLFDLLPATRYEVRLTVTDPDGGGTVQTLEIETRAVPRAEPANPRVIAVDSAGALTAALADALPGDVIELASGTYAGSFTLARSGTGENPIVLRGMDAEDTVIDASGAPYGLTITGDYVHVEDLTVRGSTWGARITDVEGVAVRRARFLDVRRGINAAANANRYLYLCDNVLEGRHAWPDVSAATWDDEGIVVTGQGHTVCHNRLSGFGDALSLSQNTGIPNVAIDFYGNEVLWTGDDGIELDYGYRNIRAFRNRITNANMGVSLQPLWGGPAYVLRNVLVNLAGSPYKLNNEPSGFLIYHNTSLRTQGAGNYGGDAWPQLGYALPGHWSFAANFELKNNLLIGLTAPARVTTEIVLAAIDSNGWAPDGGFVLYESYDDLEDLKSRSGYETHGRILESPVFATAPTLPVSYTTRVEPFAVELAASSNAVDVGLPLANINDDYSGSGPDLGAWERGAAPPHYGPRTDAAATIPMPPGNLTAD